MAIRAFNSESLNGVAAPINSSSIFLCSPKAQHTIVFKITDTDNDITAMTVVLQGSPNNRGVTDANATWEDLASEAATVTAGDKAFAFSAVDMPIKRVRLQVSSITGTSNDAADVLDAWYIEGDN